jgi:hypothetical protein
MNSSDDDYYESEDEAVQLLPQEKTIQLRYNLDLLCKADQKKYNFVRYISVRNLKQYNAQTQYASKYGAGVARTRPDFYKNNLKKIWKKDIFLYYMYAYYLSLHEAEGPDIWCDEVTNSHRDEIERQGFIDLS